MIWWCLEHKVSGNESRCDGPLAVTDECDMVEALLIVKENGEWPEGVIEQVMDRASFRSHDIIVAILDALASVGGDSQ